METLRVDGYDIRRLLGTGGCGRVYLAAGADGGWVALKFFDGMAVQRQLLAKMSARLAEGGWPAGVMPVIHADFNARPALRVTPWTGSGNPETDGHPAARSLQDRLDDFPGADSWQTVRSLANALAAMHGKRVAHGNLKPGNVFLDESGGVLLTDWTLGNMPGVGRLEFTDAILYQPPEQLDNPDGYEQEAGYRWDVYAFGSLAYRLLTGRFPRCHETFQQVAPVPGETRRDGVHADFHRIAERLAAEREVVWPDEPRNALERSFRNWISRCLDLDPHRRPVTMLEVAAGFEAAEKEEAAAQERERLLDARRRAERRLWRAVFVTGACLAAIAVLAAMWWNTSVHLRHEQQVHAKDVAVLGASLESATRGRAQAEATEEKAVQELSYVKDVSAKRLAESCETGDFLFSWAMEKDHRQLPPLDGRDLRLKRLEKYFANFIERTRDVPELAGARARARFQLAEVALSMGDPAEAERRLNDALGQQGEMDGAMKMRLAADLLEIAMLYQSTGGTQAAGAFQRARKALADVPAADAGGDRMRQMNAILDFHEAGLLAAAGSDEKALNHLLEATKALDKLVLERPDSAVLRSELAACYLASASILEGMKLLGDAREVRARAVKTLLEMLTKKPRDFSLRLELAGCYGAMAETAVLAGDTAGAEALSREAMKILEELAAEQPDNAGVTERIAAQTGLAAGLMRDRGQPEEALKTFNKATDMLEDVRAGNPGNDLISYRLALLWWQKARTLGATGKRDDEIRLLTEARALLTKLEASPSGNGPPVEQIQRSLGYLTGDLAHGLQLAGRKDDARKEFTASLECWKTLLKSRADSEEYQENANWCNQRLKELE